jgi:hypothetical protein
MSHSLLQDIEAKIDQLSADEKQILLDRLAQQVRMAKNANAQVAATLARMAADPDIQREIAAITQEFADAEGDGLEGPRSQPVSYSTRR